MMSYIPFPRWTSSPLDEKFAALGDMLSRKSHPAILGRLLRRFRATAGEMFHDSIVGTRHPICIQPHALE